MQQYDILECLSQSSQQDTYLARNVQTGEKVVVKCYPTDSPLLQADMDYSAIPGYVEEHANETYRCIVRVYYEGMNLQSYVRSHALTESECLDIALQLAPDHASVSPLLIGGLAGVATEGTGNCAGRGKCENSSRSGEKNRRNVCLRHFIYRWCV